MKHLTIRSETEDYRAVENLTREAFWNQYVLGGDEQMLIEHSFEKARSLGYDTVVIFGNLSNYVNSHSTVDR